MEQSPNPPSGAAPQPPSSDTAGFIIGVIVGLGIGGTILTMVVFLGMAAIVSFLIPSAGNTSWWALIGTLPALALGWWAVVMTRKAMNFISGGLIGLAAGLLGGVSLCTLMFAGLG